MYDKDRKNLFGTDNLGETDTKQQESVSDNEQPKETYNLYTEKIIEKPSVKYGRFISVFKWILKSAVFGLVVCFVFVLAYPYITRLFGTESETGRRPTLTIPKDEYPTDEIISDNEMYSSTAVSVDSETFQDDYIKMYAGLRQAMVATKDCMVTVSAYSNNLDQFIIEGTAGLETAGIVIGEIDSEYVIITDYNDVMSAEHLKVKFNDNTEATAYFINVEPEMGIAMICVKQSDLSAYTKSTIKMAQLGNSYLLSQGELVIAAGKLFGNVGSVNYGVATNLKIIESGIDSCYGIINTSMLKAEEDYGFLFNINGNLVGIIKRDDEENTFNAYGISDLKSLIEEMSNGSGIIYCGIVGQNVTAAISHQYNLPTGVFISEVVENSPAYIAGLQPGDVITRINNETVLTFQAFSEKLYKCDIGDTINISVKRYGKDEYKEIEFSVVLKMK